MTLNEFIAEVVKTTYAHPDWRLGQSVFNRLLELEPDMAEEIRGTKFDPFYKSANELDIFWGFIAKRLDN